MLIKLDLSKVFFIISWQYMRSLLEDFGFDNHWVDWIMRITYSSFLSILVNVIPSQPFSPTRGIRQGDPLSPFLFVIMAEGLGRYLKAYVLEGSLKFLPLHNIHSAPSHIHFVDGTLLLNTLTTQEAIKLNSILIDCVDALGMALNLEKYKLYFFNTPVAIQNHISHLLGVPKSSLPSNYLGIPFTEAVAHNIFWDSLLLSISNRLSNWTFKSLNLAAQLVLLKFVLQAFPTYLFTTLGALQSVIRAIRII
jgi:hypothetical protein